MEKVIVRIPKGGSLQVSTDMTPKQLIDMIAADLETRECVVTLAKRGRKKTVKPLSGDSEVENTDQ